MKNEILTRAEYRAALRLDFWTFAARCFAEVQPNREFMNAPYLELFAAALEAVRKGKIRRLIINVPPRSLKSHFASIAFPAWCLAHSPHQKIVCISYGQDLADTFARQSRQIMTSAWYQSLFPTRLSERMAVADFMTTEGGERLATSVGGPLTGRGGDLVIIDDPLKPDEALSEVQRKNVLTWYNNTLLSRFNHLSKDAIIIVMQRLHQNDLVAHVLEQEPWKIISLPAIAETAEMHVIESIFGPYIYRRSAGEVLNPARDPRATFELVRERDPYTFFSQYQQTPIPIEGNLVKRQWLRHYEPGEEPAQFAYIVQSWDTANKASELSDYSVCTTWGVHGRLYYLLDVYRQRLNYPELKRAVIDQAQNFAATTVLIEDKASGTQLIQDLQSEGLYAVQPYQPPPGTDKVMRLRAQTALFSSGRVYFPARASWLADYEAELIGFPGSRYNDQVDSTTQALDYLREPDGVAIWAILGAAP